MDLSERLQSQGNLLFRWRSYLPLVLAPVALVALNESGYVEAWLGEAVEEAWMMLCLAVSLTGLALRGLTVGFVPANTSGRNTSEQRADALNTTGLYSVVRNPLYLGNYLIFFGIALAVKVWWFVLLASLGFALYYERIICAEEAYLEEKFGSAFSSWAARTPAFIPRPGLWRRPELGFSPHTVLRREYNGLYLIVVSFTLIELVDDVWLQGASFLEWLRSDSHWGVIFVLGTVVFLTLRTLKKRTRLLHVSGR